MAAAPARRTRHSSLSP